MPPKGTPPKAKSVQYATGAEKVGSCKDKPIQCESRPFFSKKSSESKNGSNKNCWKLNFAY